MSNDGNLCVVVKKLVSMREMHDILMGHNFLWSLFQEILSAKYLVLSLYLYALGNTRRDRLSRIFFTSYHFFP